MKVTATEALLQFEDFEEFKGILDGELEQYPDTALTLTEIGNRIFNQVKTAIEANGEAPEEAQVDILHGWDKVYCFHVDSCTYTKEGLQEVLVTYTGTLK